MIFKYPVQNPGMFEEFSAGLIMDSENDLPTNEPGRNPMLDTGLYPILARSRCRQIGYWKSTKLAPVASLTISDPFWFILPRDLGLQGLYMLI